MTQKLTKGSIVCAAALWCTFATPVQLFAATYAEQEPNDTKYTPNVIPFLMVNNDTITGFSVGSSQTFTGDLSQDNYLVQTAALPPGIYRHQLQLTVTPPVTPPTTVDNYNSFIMGLLQTGGVIQPNTEAVAQTAPPNGYGTINPRRTVEWYGFGRSERLYYRVSGNSNTITPYTATLHTNVVLPQIVPDILSPGQITISDASTASFTFFDAWIYDANLNAIPDFGPNATSSLTRIFSAGTYYVALTHRELNNNQQAPADGTAFSKESPVLDFPDVAVVNPNTFGNNVNVNITDSVGFYHVEVNLPAPYDIVWLKLTVGGTGCTCVGDMDANSVFDGRDMPGFISSVLAGSGACADINNDAAVNTGDILPFVNVLLTGGPCS